MEPIHLESQHTLSGRLDAAHITVRIPIDDGKIAIGFQIEVTDPEGGLIHSEAWSRGSFHSDTHALFTAALSIRRILAQA